MSKVFLSSTGSGNRCSYRPIVSYVPRIVGAQVEAVKYGGSIKFLDKYGREIDMNELIGRKLSVIG